MDWFLRLFLCILAAGWWLYAAVDYQNRVTELRIQIPPITKEVARLKEENLQLQYQIECFENPAQLIDLIQQPEYGHLVFPYERDVVVIEGGSR